MPPLEPENVEDNADLVRRIVHVWPKEALARIAAAAGKTAVLVALVLLVVADVHR